MALLFDVSFARVRVDTSLTVLRSNELEIRRPHCTPRKPYAFLLPHPEEGSSAHHHDAYPSAALSYIPLGIGVATHRLNQAHDKPPNRPSPVASRPSVPVPAYCYLISLKKVSSLTSGDGPSSAVKVIKAFYSTIYGYIRGSELQRPCCLRESPLSTWLALKGAKVSRVQ
jgi:hypothetical protein